MIVDFRCRPPFEHFLEDPIIYANGAIERALKIKGVASQAALNKDVELFLKEVRDAGVDKIVMPGRGCVKSHNVSVRNFMQMHPELTIGLYGIEACDPMDEILASIKENVLEGPFQGVCIEPGLSPDPMHCDDKRLFPIYEECQKHDIPMLLAFGGLCHRSLNNFSPEQLDNVAIAFPKLKITIAHGGWPWVNQVCWIAFARPNVYISPDSYVHFGAGRQGYVDAANTVLSRKIIFGSAYPAWPVEFMLARYKEAGFNEKALPRVLGLNALEALNLA